MSSGSVTGSSDVGGLIGSIFSSLTDNCYTIAASSGNGLIGGTVSSGHIVTSCFYNTDISSSGGPGTGATTAEMKSLGLYVNAGWDMAGEVQNGTNDFWVLFPGDYPIFNNDFNPEITGVYDVPGDQGHQLELVWNRSVKDIMIDPACAYSIWRKTQNVNNLDDDAVIMTSFDEFTIPEEDDDRQFIISVDNQYWISSTMYRRLVIQFTHI